MTLPHFKLCAASSIARHCSAHALCCLAGEGTVSGLGSEDSWRCNVLLEPELVLERYGSSDARQSIICSCQMRLNCDVGSRSGIAVIGEEFSSCARNLIERQAKCRARYGLLPKWVRYVTIY